MENVTIQRNEKLQANYKEYIFGKNLKIQLVSVDRAKPLTPEQVSEYSQLIQNSDGAIVEYFPPELTEFESDPTIKSLANFFTDYDKIVRFYSSIADTAAGYSKDIYNFDPAYSKSFAAVLRFIPGIVMGVSGGYSLGVGVDVARELKKRNISRRTFLKASSAILAGAAFKKLWDSSILPEGFQQQADLPGDNLSENLMRRVIVAKAIFEESQNSNTKTLVMFYSPLHCQGFDYLFTHQDELEKSFDETARLLKPIFKDSFFVARHYSYETDKKRWSLKSKREI